MDGANNVGSLRIDSGVKRIAIDDDPARIIEFNPTDVAWAEKFQAERRGVEAKYEEFLDRSNQLDAKMEAAESDEKIELQGEVNGLRRELCVYSREKIDLLFGEGSSQKAFGDLMSEWAILSFFEGITPHINIARSSKMDKYLNPPPKPKRKRK